MRVTNAEEVQYMVRVMFKEYMRSTTEAMRKSTTADVAKPVETKVFEQLATIFDLS